MLTHTHVYCDNTLQGSSTNQQWLPVRDYGRENNGTMFGKNSSVTMPTWRLRSTGMSWAPAPDGWWAWAIMATKCFKCWPTTSWICSGVRAISALFQFFPNQDTMSVKAYSPFLDSLAHRHEQSVYLHQLGRFHQYRTGYLLDTQYTNANLIITNDYVDLTPPGVCGFSYAGVPPTIKVTFNEPVETVSAQTVTNYSINNGIYLTSATLLSDGRTVALATDSDFTPNTLYTLTINHVKDCSRAANAIIIPVTTPSCIRLFYLPMTSRTASKVGRLWTKEPARHRPSGLKDPNV